MTLEPKSIDVHFPHITIVGGGIAGLATAYYLQQAGHHNYTLLDSGPVWGGKIQTDIRDEFVIEGGPDSFITQKPEGVRLCRELGLESDLVGTNDAGRKVYVLLKGKLQAMPEGVMLVIPTKFTPFALSPLISIPGKLRMGMDLIIPRRRDNGDESLAGFIRRRLGQEALDKIAEPLMAGIYVADAENLSLQSTFPRFINLENKHRSLILGMLAQKARAKSRPAPSLPLFMTLRGGLRQLIEALVSRLDGDLRLDACVTKVERDQNGAENEQSGYTLHLENGDKLRTDVLVLAVPAFAAAELLEPLHSQLAARLKNIPYISTANISLAFKRSEFEHPLNGFGFVIPAKEPTSLMACTWTSTKFNYRAPEDHVLIRTFVGGPHHEDLVELDDETILAMVQDELARIMGIKARPVLSRLFRWRRANPQYLVGHPDRLQEMETMTAALPGLYLTGSAYHGVGIPDCIKQGQATVEKIVSEGRIS